MRDWIWDSDIPGNSRFTLSYMTAFRICGCELHFTLPLVASEVGISVATARRHIDKLISVGVFWKAGTTDYKGLHLGIYRFHFDKLRPRPELLRYRASKARNVVRFPSSAQ